jgi:hypothetical protein
MLDLEIPVQFNHIGFSVARDSLEGKGLDQIRTFFSEVFGFIEREEFTKERDLLVLMAGGVDQFVVFMGHDQPTVANPPMDHFGMRVKSLDDLKTILAKAQAFKDRTPDVELTEYEIVPMNDVVPHNLHRYYMRYGTPFTLEVQYYEMLGA